METTEEGPKDLERSRTKIERKDLLKRAKKVFLAVNLASLLATGSPQKTDSQPIQPTITPGEEDQTAQLVKFPKLESIEDKEKSRFPSLEERLLENVSLRPQTPLGQVHVFSSAASLEPGKEYSTADNYQWGGKRGYLDPFNGEQKEFEEITLDGKKYTQIVPPFEKLTVLGPLNLALIPHNDLTDEDGRKLLTVFKPEELGEIVIRVGGEVVLKEDLAKILSGEVFPNLKRLGLISNHNDRDEGGGFSLHFPIAAERIEVLLEKPQFFDCVVYFPDEGKSDSLAQIKDLLTGKIESPSLAPVEALRSHPEEKVNLVGEKRVGDLRRKEIIKAKENQLIQALRFKIPKGDLENFLNDYKVVIDYGDEQTTEIPLGELFGFLENYKAVGGEKEERNKGTTFVPQRKKYVGGIPEQYFLTHGLRAAENKKDVIVWLNYPIPLGKGGSIRLVSKNDKKPTNGLIEYSFEKIEGDIKKYPRLFVCKHSNSDELKLTAEPNILMSGGAILIEQVVFLHYGATPKGQQIQKELGWTMPPMEGDTFITYYTEFGEETSSVISGAESLTPGGVFIL